MGSGEAILHTLLVLKKTKRISSISRTGSLTSHTSQRLRLVCDKDASAYRREHVRQAGAAGAAEENGTVGSAARLTPPGRMTPSTAHENHSEKTHATESVVASRYRPVYQAERGTSVHDSERNMEHTVFLSHCGVASPLWGSHKELEGKKNCHEGVHVQHTERASGSMKSTVSNMSCATRTPLHNSIGQGRHELLGRKDS